MSTAEPITTPPQVELNLFTGVPLLADSVISGNSANSADSANSANSARLPESLVRSFAAATGWELGITGNKIQIVDMSSAWPARTPTAHRGKCDLLAAEISKLLDAGR